MSITASSYNIDLAVLHTTLDVTSVTDIYVYMSTPYQGEPQAKYLYCIYPIDTPAWDFFFIHS